MSEVVVDEETGAKKSTIHSIFQIGATAFRDMIRSLGIAF